MHRWIFSDPCRALWYKTGMWATFISLLIVMLAGSAWAQDRPWKAGAARVRITPQRPTWMTGYAARTQPATRAVHDLYAKALVLEDSSGQLAALVSIDVLAICAGVSDSIAHQAEARFGLKQDRLILSCTHTHSGPALADPNRILVGPRTTDEQWRETERYTAELESRVLDAIGDAMRQRRAARLVYGRSTADFAMNRRQSTEKGVILGVNEQGPVDRDVPVLRVESADGKLLAIVFGYACHNTTCGQDCMEFHGDYAGFAEEELQRRHPGTVAMFIIGCAGDANPYPRKTIELARQHGQALAAAVDAPASMRKIGGPLKSARDIVGLAFAPPPTREALELQLKQKDIFRQWQARKLLAVIDRDGKLPSEYPAPQVVWRIGNDLTFIAMSGEVVSDYALRLKRELGAERTWVAGYCNDVFAYVPTRQILQEGGYEPVDSMIYYVQPGPFAPSIEETLIGKIRELVVKAGGKQP